MLKKILSLTLCLCICLGVVFSATSCGSKKDETTTSSTDAVPTTLSFLGVTSELTDRNNVQMVEDALNDIFSSRFKTKIDLTLVTEDKYMALIEERIEEAKYWQTYDSSILQYNAYIKKQANQTGTTTDKIFGNWIAGGVEVSLETLATRLVFLSEQTTVHSDGRVETLYPEATPIDIVMILDEEMYDEFDDIGLLVDQIDPNSTSLKTLQKYIYPTFFTELTELKGAINAIPNNNLLAESTYLVINKKLAEKYNFNIDKFTGYADLAPFLAEVKKNEKVVPFNSVPEALGVFKLFSEDVAVGTYFDPMMGYAPEEDEKYGGFEIQNLFEIPQYVEHLALMETYQKSGYFEQTYWESGYAVQVIEGDASVVQKYSGEDSEYEVKQIQIPFVLREAIFDGMLAYTSYCEEPARALEIIEAINTDPEVKNLLQYGIPEYNYIAIKEYDEAINQDVTRVIRIGGGYIMENAYTGNVYMGHLEESMRETSWAYVKQTNLASKNSPFLIFPVDEEYLQDNLAAILKDAALAEAIKDANLSFDFAEYREAEGSLLVSYNNMFKNAYKDFFIDELVAGGKASDKEKAEDVFKGGSVAISWYEDTLANKYVNENYSKIQTLESIESLVNLNLANSAIIEGANYWPAKNKAEKYLENIESLRVIARITLFNDLSDEDYQKKYGSLSIADFEKAVYNYLREEFIRENNLTPDGYKDVIHEFIAKELTFTNQSTKVQYTYTWKNYIDIKAKAEKFSTAIEKAKVEYRKTLLANGHKSEDIEKWDDATLAANIIDAIKYQYYNSKNTSAGEYLTWIYNNFVLNKYGITYDTLNSYKTVEKETYRSYLLTIKKDYKKQLLENYTKAEYEALSEVKAFEAIGQYFVEQTIGAQASLCNTMGVSKAEYKDLCYYMEEYVKCLKQMRTSFIYTLSVYYKQSTTEIFAWTVDKIEDAVYEAVAEYGYNTTQIAQFVGLNLSDYNFNKSEAATYLGYVEKLIEANYANLVAAGYDTAVVKTYAPEKVEEIIRDIIREKDFADYKTIDTIFSEMCKDAVTNVNDWALVQKEGGAKEYCKKQSEKLAGNFLFEALISYLNTDLQAQLEAAKPQAN